MKSGKNGNNLFYKYISPSLQTKFITDVHPVGQFLYVQPAQNKVASKTAKSKSKACSVQT
jgi:hypothetical protein